jgi:2-keto-4-pentenoate hydratase/2-oxohepta-3-ene-1,7-dioic acid hydratase in catechol pathway
MTIWVRFAHAGSTGFGTLDGDQIAVHDGDMFAQPTPTGETLPLADVTLLTPTNPSKFIALWNNFHAAAEKQGNAVPAEPLYFLKAANSFLAHGQKIRKPRFFDGRVLYEGELGIVIGKRASAISEDEAASHIFGYTCVNDVTAMELLNRDPSFAQWTRAKSFDTFGVFGPGIATGIDPQTLSVRTLLNGKERQNYPVSDMIFRPEALVSLISRDMTLEPGDVIACGTSLGVLPMRPGMVVEVAIDGVGTLANEFADA